MRHAMEAWCGFGRDAVHPSARDGASVRHPLARYPLEPVRVCQTAPTFRPEESTPGPARRRDPTAMRRLMPLLLAAALGMVIPPAVVGAATVVHARSSGLGAMAFLSSDDGTTTVTTTMAMATNVIGGDGQPLPGGTLFIGNDRYDDATGAFLGGSFGMTSGLPFALGPHLTGVTVDASFTWTTCDASGTCADEPVNVHATWTGEGPIFRSHNTGVGGTSGQFQSLFHVRTNFRFASAAASVDGVSAGSPLSDSRPILFDASQSNVDITINPDGSLLASSVLPTVSAPPVSQSISVQGTFADGNWSSVTDDIQVDTFILATSQASSANGSIVRLNALSFQQVVSSRDAYGNLTPIMEIFGDGTASHYVTDAKLQAWSVDGSVPATTCVFDADGQPVCVDGDVIAVTAAWTGTGTIDRSHSVQVQGTAGFSVFNTRRNDAQRQAGVTGSVAGGSLGDGLGSIMILHDGQVVIQH